VEGSDPLVFTGLPPSLVVAMGTVSHTGVRCAKREHALACSRASAHTGLFSRKRSHSGNFFGGSYVVGASNSAG
jgi:hypothetical protein